MTITLVFTKILTPFSDDKNLKSNEATAEQQKIKGNFLSTYLLFDK